jgi:acyl-CoA thioesterase-1
MFIKKLIFFLLLLQTAPLLASPKTIYIVGDSITEGYGVEKEKAFPALLEKSLGSGWKIVNSGISGSTSASAPGRINWVIKAKPNAAMIALGGNDGLRGLPPEALEKSLSQAIEAAQAAGVKVLLAGMLAPPNMGENYTKKFKVVYPRLAKKYKIPLFPFLLEGVAGNPELNLNDGIHPNEKGHVIIAENIKKFIESNGNFIDGKK